jgi:hypothetical protein
MAVKLWPLRSNKARHNDNMFVVRSSVRLEALWRGHEARAGPVAEEVPGRTRRSEELALRAGVAAIDGRHIWHRRSPRLARSCRKWSPAASAKGPPTRCPPFVCIDDVVPIGEGRHLRLPWAIANARG